MYWSTYMYTLYQRPLCVCSFYMYRWSDQIYAEGYNPKPPHLFIHPYFQVRATGKKSPLKKNQ